MTRIIVWYSDGEASAVAAKLAVKKYGSRCEVIKCDTTKSEHPDNERFRLDVERWIGREIELIRSDKYETVDDVFEQTKYMSGVAGARCTVELKKVPRFAYQRADDIHIFGLTVDEWSRIEEFKKNNPELTFDWILRDNFIRKSDCRRMLIQAGIEPPVMYELGFDHNNCLACCKATSPGYWNRTRRHFPEAFNRRAKQSRAIGARLVRVNNVRIFLDELSPEIGLDESDGEIDCGPFCLSPQSAA
jgi:hypothetical protein